ncbi:STAS domain-containing protein [Actinokineospora sp. 24-640]
MERVSWSVVPTALPAMNVIGDDEHLTVLVAGEIDALTAPDFADVLGEALRASPRAVSVDLRSVTFFGAAGLGVLVDCQESVLGRPVRWRVLVSPHSIVRRVFTATELEGRLNMVAVP